MNTVVNVLAHIVALYFRARDFVRETNCVAFVLRAVFVYEAKKLGVQRPDFAVVNDFDDNRRAGYDFRWDVAWVNVATGDISDWRKRIRHELRHKWQMTHYEEAVRFYASLHAYVSTEDGYTYCPLEVDARLYGEGVRRDDILDSIGITENYVEAMRELCKKEGVPERTT